MHEQVGATLDKCDKIELLVTYIAKKNNNVLEEVSQHGLNQSVTFFRLEWDVGKHYQKEVCAEGSQDF